jgi:hypothetical protein
VNLKEVQTRVKLIRTMAGDPEAAHGAEDSLHYDVLSAIATGEIKGKEARECASLASTTEGIDFKRWTA